MKEAERLYLINCGICHGQKLDGEGPLYNGGNGPFASAPANFVGDPQMISYARRTNVLLCYLWQEFNGKLCVSVNENTTLDGDRIY